MWILEAVTLTAVLASGLESGAMEAGAQQLSEPRIWLDRGVDPVLEPGDRVRLYYRTDADAYLAILQIDTDGTTRMLYPRSPTENHYARADRDYRLLFPRSAYWNVDDRPGVGYFFVVTSPTPFDLSDFRYSHYDGGWDLSAVGSTVYSDPYVAMDDYVARLVPDWETLDYGLDFISYRVGADHEYPRFLCYQCHGFRPYSTWNPYRYTCVDFRVVVYDDPYFYPSRRYRADRVVMVGPRSPTLGRFAFKERAAGEPGTPIRVARQSVRESPPPVADRPSADQRAGRGRVASPPVVQPVVPPVVPHPTTTKRRDLSGRDVAPRVRSDGGRVTPPPSGDVGPARVRDLSAPDAVPRRPTLQRRSTPPSQGPRSRPETARPRPTPTPTRPSTRPPPEPSSGSQQARPRQSTRRSPERSNGSSTARPAPREGPRTPSANKRATRPPPRRQPS